MTKVVLGRVWIYVVFGRGIMALILCWDLGVVMETDRKKNGLKYERALMAVLNFIVIADHLCF